MKVPHLYTEETIGMFHCLEKVNTKKTKELIENEIKWKSILKRRNING